MDNLSLLHARSKECMTNSFIHSLLHKQDQGFIPSGALWNSHPSISPGGGRGGGGHFHLSQRGSLDFWLSDITLSMNCAQLHNCVTSYDTLIKKNITETQFWVGQHKKKNLSRNDCCT